MHDIKPLEEQWKKYCAKKRRPWYLFFITVSLLLVLGIGIYENKNFKLPSFKFDFLSKTTMIKSKKHADIIVNPALSTLAEKNVVEKKEILNEKNEENVLVDLPILDVRENSTVTELPKERKKVHLDIIESSTVTAYKDVEKRFLISHDVDDAFFLAKSYYKKGNYKKSEYWAYETNKINNNNIESLFIFIKSKIKLGKKEEGSSILRTYIKKTESEDAKALLSEIENNKL